MDTDAKRRSIEKIMSEIMLFDEDSDDNLRKYKMVKIFIYEYIKSIKLAVEKSDYNDFIKDFDYGPTFQIKSHTIFISVSRNFKNINILIGVDTTRGKLIKQEFSIDYCHIPLKFSINQADAFMEQLDAAFGTYVGFLKRNLYPVERPITHSTNLNTK